MNDHLVVFSGWGRTSNWYRNVLAQPEVEVQLGTTNEAIESLKGEIKYYDNRIGLSTLTLQIAEKDLGQPFEYVQTLQANLALTVVFVAFMMLVGQRHIESNTMKVAKVTSAALALPAL